MSKTTHTPPPWRAGMNPGPIIYGPQGEQIADLRADLLPREERTANLRLIAAAPELLAALEAISHWAGVANDVQHSGETVSSLVWSELYACTNSARAAIAKATGK